MLDCSLKIMKNYHPSWKVLKSDAKKKLEDYVTYHHGKPPGIFGLYSFKNETFFDLDNDKDCFLLGYLASEGLVNRYPDCYWISSAGYNAICKNWLDSFIEKFRDKAIYDILTFFTGTLFPTIIIGTFFSISVEFGKWIFHRIFGLN